MRPLPVKYLQEIFKPTKVVGLVLGLGSLVFLGGVCKKIPQTNTNSTVSPTNTGSDANVGTNAVVNGNLGTNTSIVNTNTNTEAHANSNTNLGENTNSAIDTNASDIDTSDWLTYTNEEYGFSFRYPKEYLTWEGKPDQTNKKNNYLLLDIGIRPTDIAGAVILIRVVDYPLGKLSDLDQSIFGKSTGKEILVAGQKAQVFSGALARIVFERNHKTYFISTSDYYYDKEDEWLLIYYGVLNSFHFNS